MDILYKHAVILYKKLKIFQKTLFFKRADIIIIIRTYTIVNCVKKSKKIQTLQKKRQYSHHQNKKIAAVFREIFVKSFSRKKIP